MADIKAILRVGTDLQSLAVAGQSLKLAQKKKKSSKDFLKTGTTTIAGLGLINAQNQIINDL